MIEISQEQFDRLIAKGYADVVIEDNLFIFCQGQIFKVKSPKVE